MDPFSKYFIRSSLAWFAAATTLGVAMAMRPTLAAYRTAHLHMALLGFVAMMIYGVAYHVIPRFSGNPLHSPRLASLHVPVANVGLALMAAGFAARIQGASAGGAMLAAGGTLSALGSYAFVYNVWRTIDGRDATREAARRAAVLRAAQAPAGRRLHVELADEG